MSDKPKQQNYTLIGICGILLTALLWAGSWVRCRFFTGGCYTNWTLVVVGAVLILLSVICLVVGSKLSGGTDE